MESGGVHIEIEELPCCKLCRFLDQKLIQTIDDNDISHLMIFASKTQPFIVTTSTKRMDDLKWWFEGYKAMAIDISRLEINQ